MQYDIIMLFIQKKQYLQSISVQGKTTFSSSMCSIEGWTMMKFGGYDLFFSSSQRTGLLIRSFSTLYNSIIPGKTDIWCWIANCNFSVKNKFHRCSLFLLLCKLFSNSTSYYRWQTLDTDKLEITVFYMSYFIVGCEPVLFCAKHCACKCLELVCFNVLNLCSEGHWSHQFCLYSNSDSS